MNLLKLICTHVMQIRGRSILDSPHEVWDLEADVECPDELEDALVDTVVDLVSSCFRFKKKMFKGGATVLELSRIRNKKRKGKMPKDNNESDDSSDSSGEDTTDQDSGNDLANMVSIKLKEEISRIVEKVSKGVEHQVKIRYWALSWMIAYPGSRILSPH